MTIHSGILAWEISWTEEPGRLQLMGSQRGGHNLATKQQIDIYISFYIHAVTIDIYILIHIVFFRLFSILSYYKILDIILCAMQ